MTRSRSATLGALRLPRWLRTARARAAPGALAVDRSAPRDIEIDLERALTELAEAHAELTRRQSLTDALLETIEVGIVSCDAQGVFLVSNRAEREMFGLQEGLQGRLPQHLGPLIDVFGPDGSRLAVEDYPLMRTLRGENIPPLDVLVGPAGGPHREVVVRGSRIIGPDGAVLGAVAALTDVTAERRAGRALAEEHRLLTEAQRLGQLGSYEVDFATGTWTFSEQLCVLWGVEAEGLTPEVFVGLIVDEEDRELARACWQSASRVGGRHSAEFRIRRASDGAERLIRSSIEVERGPDDRPRKGRGTHLDITDLTVAEQAAQRANAFLNAVLSATPDFTFVSDLATGTIIYRSRDQDVLRSPGEPVDALRPGATAEVIHPDDQELLHAVNVAAADLADGHVLELRYRGQQPDGQWRWLNRRVTPFRRGSGGDVVEILGVVHDVTDLVQAESRLTYATLHDGLTGLPNRSLLVDRLDAALTRSERDGREVAVLFCDLDGFKNVNDTGGHSAGDAVLLEISHRLNSVLREGDTVARVGGDEFVIIVEPWHRTGHDDATDEKLPGEQPHRALAVQVAERVAEVLRAPVRVNGIDHVVSASIGITYAALDRSGRLEAVTADQVLQDADVAMYRAKGRGKDRFEVFANAARPALSPPPTVGQVRRI